MKKLITLVVIGVLATLITSCNEDCENERGECPDEQLAEDIRLIEEYLDQNNLSAEKLPAYDLYYIIEEQGTGESPVNQQEVEVNYVGRFLNDKVFDSSYTQNEPFSFVVGLGQVILGWDLGIKLINEGGKITLFLPSYLAYGPNRRGTIPPNSVLIFEVELVNILD